MSEDYSHIIEGAALRASVSWQCAADNVWEEMTRPSVVRRPRIYRDGGQWCALLGDDIQTGVSGFGASPEAACVAFDKAWHAEVPAEPADTEDHHVPPPGLEVPYVG